MKPAKLLNNICSVQNNGIRRTYAVSTRSTTVNWLIESWLVRAVQIKRWDKTDLNNMGVDSIFRVKGGGGVGCAVLFPRGVSGGT